MRKTFYANHRWHILDNGIRNVQRTHSTYTILSICPQWLGNKVLYMKNGMIALALQWESCTSKIWKEWWPSGWGYIFSHSANSIVERQFKYECDQGCSANKKVWKSIQKIAIWKQLPTHFKTKCEKGVGTPFPRVLALLYTPEDNDYLRNNYHNWT